MTKYLEKTTFTFDNAYGEDSHNEEIYQDVVRPLVSAAFQKSKVTCFGYGQTGSGKTFTMMGDAAKGVPGLYLLAANDIFQVRKGGFKDVTVGRRTDLGLGQFLRNLL